MTPIIKYIFIAGAIAVGVVILSQQNINMGCNPPEVVKVVRDTTFTPYEVIKIVRDTTERVITIIRKVVVYDTVTGIARLDTTIDRGGIAPDTMNITYATRTNEFTLRDRPAPRTRDSIFSERDREINTEITVEKEAGFFESIGSSIKSIASHLLAFVAGFATAKVMP